MWWRCVAPLLGGIVLAGTAACGGSGGGDDGNGGGGPSCPLSPAVEVEIPVSESYGLLAANPTVKGSAVWVGDSGTFDADYRGIFRFDTEALPAGTTIVSATFETVRRQVADTPEALLGENLLDDVGYEFNTLSGLNAMYAYTLAYEFAKLEPSLGGAFVAEVGERLQAALDDGRTRCRKRS